MDGQDSFNNVGEAVLAFYDAQNPRQGKAQQWLAQLQNTPEMWNIVWNELLASGQMELQFYGCSVLHSLLIHNWNVLTPEQYEPLKNKLLEAIIFFRDGPRVVLNRLCISAAVYLLRSSLAVWPTGISDLISLFQPSVVPNIPAEMLAWILLQILAAVPEEFQSIILSRNEKNHARCWLMDNSFSVLALMESMYEVKNPDLHLQLLKCVKSWLEFGLPVENCEKTLDFLIQSILETHEDEDKLQNTINAIEGLSILCSHPLLERFDKTVIRFMNKMLDLADIFGSHRRNRDYIPSLFTLFVSTGEAHLKILLRCLGDKEHLDMAQRFINVIMLCTDAPGTYPVDEVYSMQTFSFWYLIQDEVLINYKIYDRRLKDILKPYYKSLVLILLNKAKYPENFDDYSKEDKDAFVFYRQDIADTYMYCYEVVGACIQDILLGMLGLYMGGDDPVLKWREIEVHSHCFLSMADALSSTDDPRIVRYFNIMKERYPCDHMPHEFTRTFLHIIGSYSIWFNSHPEFLNWALSFVMRSIPDENLVVSATMALKNIARDCQAVLLPYAEYITTTARDILSLSKMKTNEECRLVYCAAKVCCILPYDSIMQILPTMVQPYSDSIQMLMEKPVDSETETAIANAFGCLTQIFLGLDASMPEPPTLLLLKNLLPGYRAFIQRYNNNVAIATVCQSIKCGLSNLHDEALPILPTVVELLILTFRGNNDDSILELGKQIVILYGKKPEVMEIVSTLVRELCTETMNLLSRYLMKNNGGSGGGSSSSNDNETPSSSAISECSNVLEQFFLFTGVLVKKTPHLLLHTPGVDAVNIFRCGAISLCAMESSTVKAATGFLCNFIICSRENEELLTIVQNNGAEVVYQVMVAIGGAAPRTSLENLTNVLCTLCKKYPDLCSRWMQEIVMKENFPSHLLDEDMKKRFVKTVLKEKSNKRRMSEIVKEFSFVCRGLLDREYMEQTATTFV